MLYRWLGWITFGLCLILLAKFIVRILKMKTINKVLRKTHKPLGIVAFIIGMVHGLHYLIKKPQKIVENITGVVSLVLIALLIINFISRKKLKSKWFFLHRLMSVIFTIILIVHLIVSIV